MVINQKSRWDDYGVEPPAGSAKYTAGEQPIAEYDNWFNKAVVDDIAALNSWLDNLGITKIYIDTEANMPASGTTKELFIATDTNKIYRGTGTGWQLLTTEWNAILDKPFESFSSIPSSILPSLGNSYDLGSPTKTWRNGYFAGELDIGGLKIDGTTVFTSNRVLTNTIFDSRYNPGEFTLNNFQPNNLYLAHLRGYTITWNDTTGLSNTDNIWFTDMSETYMTINMSTAADPLVLTVLGNLAVSTKVDLNRLVVVWHASKGYNDIKFEVLRNDDVWVEVPLDFETSVGDTTYQVSERINPYAPHPTYTPWKGFRITFSNKVTTTGYKYLYGVIYYVPRDPYPCFVRKSGDTIFGTLTAQQINPRSDNTYDLGSSLLRWRNGYFAGTVDAGSLNIGGTSVITSGKVLQNIASVAQTLTPSTDNTYDLGSSSLRWANIYGVNVYAGSIHFGDGTTLSSASGLTGKTLYAADETEVSTTSTTPTSVKQFNLVKLAGAGLNWNTLTVVLEAYNTAGQTTNVDIVIGGTTYATLSWTENAYALKYTTIDISGLGDGKYLVDFKMYVTGGTGYLRHMEVWVE